MTSTTPHYGWPYPQPGDARGAGANTIRDGLLAVEASVRDDNMAVTILPGESAQAVAPTGTLVDFPGAFPVAGGVEGFTFDGSTVTYAGPSPRMFLVWAQVEVEANADPSVGALDSAVYLRVDGVEIASSSHMVATAVDADQSGPLGPEPGMRGLSHTHHITVPMVLGPGQAITLTAHASAGGQLGYTALRCYPMGPLQP